MKPWWKVVELRKEVREGRSFNPDEFAIHLEQVVSGRAPLDYRDPAQFFSRTYFTRALIEHAGMVLRRLAGRTDNTAPVLTLVTQFGGGKTHALTAIYHLARTGPEAERFAGVPELIERAGLTEVPKAKPAVFVGNAWDPTDGAETPWIDMARQLAGSDGVALLGADARTTPPGTTALQRVFEAAGQPVVLLLDEVLNFINRHRKMAEPFHAFIQNLTVATTGVPNAVAVISLPRSQVEMTDWDLEWQEKISKVVRRVAKDLIVNDEGEIAEVIRRRLFESLGEDPTERRRIAREYADYCFERRAQLPPEILTMGSDSGEKKARAQLMQRFEECYPFHPATLSVFQRKWSSLSQYQQTRGTLAMLAQWVSKVSEESFKQARREPLITLGSAPLHLPEFRSVVLGQIGESRLGTAIETDISSETSHARALDADCSGPLVDIHRRVGTVILFESSGGQTDKSAHLPEIRFALLEPQIDTTSIDVAASKLEARGFYVRKVGSDGFKLGHKAKIERVVAERRASLDEEKEVAPVLRKVVKEEFLRGATVPMRCFPEDDTAVIDEARVSIVVADPAEPWSGDGQQRALILTRLRQRGSSPRMYPAAPVWCFARPGRDTRDKVEEWLAWQRVQKDLAEGLLGEEYDKSELSDVTAKVKAAGDAVRDEVWAAYRHVVLMDPSETSGLRHVDLGAGHSSASETLSGRILSQLKAESLLNETVGAGYLERKWPEALKASGTWPLASLRQCFANGTLYRLLDPEQTLRRKIVEFVEKGDFGLASGFLTGGGFQRVRFCSPISPDDVLFDADTYLITKERATALHDAASDALPPPATPTLETTPLTETQDDAHEAPASDVVVRVTGAIPAEAWNRFGTKVLPKLRTGKDVRVEVDLSATVPGSSAAALKAELQQGLQDIGIGDDVTIE